MNPEGVNLLEQLRDIHAAPAAPWWPPAPGWWIAAALLLLLLFMLGKRFLVWLRVQRRRKAWLEMLNKALGNIDASEQPREYLAQINQVFKIVAMRAFPEEPCAGLEGESWVQFLQTKIDDAAAPALEVLCSGPYQPAPEYDAAVVTQLARHWIRQYG